LRTDDSAEVPARVPTNFHFETNCPSSSGDLKRLAKAWPGLPIAIRTAILALVEAVTSSG